MGSFKDVEFDNPIDYEKEGSEGMKAVAWEESIFGNGEGQWTWDANESGESLRRYQVDSEQQLKGRCNWPRITLLLVTELGDRLDYEELGTFDSVEEARAEAVRRES